MPIFTPRRLIFGAIILGTAGYGYHRYEKAKRDRAAREAEDEARRRRELEECLNGVWSEPRELVPDVLSHLWGPAATAALTSSGRTVSVKMTPQAQRDAFKLGQYLAEEGRTQDREAAIKTILQTQVAPGCDWSKGYLPYQHDPRFRAVWEATEKLLDLAELNRKYARREGKGALLCPGWVHEKPAPSTDLRPGDYLEVLIDELSADPTHDDDAEWAWARVDEVPGREGPVRATLVRDTPEGAQPHVIRKSERHGFVAGDTVQVPRHCVFNVVQGA